MSTARRFYSFALWCAAPLAMLYLLWRSRRQPEYRKHWNERFGWVRYARPAAPTLWVHAVSVGETQAAKPLIAELLTRHPQHRLLLTHMTPTGRQAGADVVNAWPGRVDQCYLPYDFPFAMRRFLRAFRPTMGLVLETEVWPNLVAIAREELIPLALVNARLSEKSLAKSQRFPALMREANAGFALIAAQTSADAARLERAGGRDIKVMGNLKFDLVPDAVQRAAGYALRDSLNARPLWLFASMREGEEILLLDALAASSFSSAPLIVLVPRHPQRFDEVENLICSRGFEVKRRSGMGAVPKLDATDAQVILGDSMGEMTLYYAAADVAFIGGSLLPLGGQNLIEACAVGTPVVVGPSTFNFAQATEDAIAAGAALRAADAMQALKQMQAIASDSALRTSMSAAGCAFAAEHRGATARALALIEPLLRPIGPRAR